MYIKESVMEMAKNFLYEEVTQDYDEFIKNFPSVKDMDKQFNTFVSIANKCHDKLKQLASSEPSITTDDKYLKESIDFMKQDYTSSKAKLKHGDDFNLAIELGNIDKSKVRLFQFDKLKNNIKTSLTDCIPENLRLWKNGKYENQGNHVIQYGIIVNETSVFIVTEKFVKY